MAYYCLVRNNVGCFIRNTICRRNGHAKQDCFGYKSHLDCIPDNELLSGTTSPIEAGLGWITKFVEGKNFTNRPMLEKQKAEGTTRKLVGFEMIDRGIPRHGYELYSTDGIAIGVVTSGTMSPTRKIGIGMGYIRPEYSKVGTEICIDMRGRKLKAVVVKPPFRKQ